MACSSSGAVPAATTSAVVGALERCPNRVTRRRQAGRARHRGRQGLGKRRCRQIRGQTVEGLGNPTVEPYGPGSLGAAGRARAIDRRHGDGLSRLRDDRGKAREHGAPARMPVELVARHLGNRSRRGHADARQQPRWIGHRQKIQQAGRRLARGAGTRGVARTLADRTARPAAPPHAGSVAPRLPSQLSTEARTAGSRRSIQLDGARARSRRRAGKSHWARAEHQQFGRLGRPGGHQDMQHPHLALALFYGREPGEAAHPPGIDDAEVAQARQLQARRQPPGQDHRLAPDRAAGRQRDRRGQALDQLAHEPAEPAQIAAAEERRTGCQEQLEQPLPARLADPGEKRHRVDERRLQRSWVDARDVAAGACDPHGRSAQVVGRHLSDEHVALAAVLSSQAGGGQWPLQRPAVEQHRQPSAGPGLGRDVVEEDRGAPLGQSHDPDRQRLRERRGARDRRLEGHHSLVSGVQLRWMSGPTSGVGPVAFAVVRRW